MNLNWYAANYSQDFIGMLLIITELYWYAPGCSCILIGMLLIVHGRNWHTADCLWTVLACCLLLIELVMLMPVHGIISMLHNFSRDLIGMLLIIFETKVACCLLFMKLYWYAADCSWT